MNEQFKKLALKAGCRSRKFTTGVGMYQGVDNDLQKFAELIVGECLDIVANADMTELEGPDPEDVLYVACKQIKEHFGVEE